MVGVVGSRGKGSGIKEWGGGCQGVVESRGRDGGGQGVGVVGSRGWGDGRWW